MSSEFSYHRGIKGDHLQLEMNADIFTPDVEISPFAEQLSLKGFIAIPI